MEIISVHQANWIYWASLICIVCIILIIDSHFCFCVSGAGNFKWSHSLLSPDGRTLGNCLWPETPSIYLIYRQLIWGMFWCWLSWKTEKIVTKKSKLAHCWTKLHPPHSSWDSLRPHSSIPSLLLVQLVRAYGLIQNIKVIFTAEKFYWGRATLTSFIFHSLPLRYQ